MKTFIISLFVIVATLSIKTKAKVKNVVQVHGAFAGGSGYKNLYTLLKARGYKVSVVRNPNETPIRQTGRAGNHYQIKINFS
jgi:hypothetical protein